MDCFHDFCLACDRESTSGPYCSQQCRLADLEKATSPSSPTSPSHHQQSSWAPSGSGSAPGYFLSQAYKFPAPTPNDSRQQLFDDKPSRSPPQSSTSSDRPTREGLMDAQKSLTPSSSRTSLSSNASHSNSNSVSERAKQELQEYFSAFHQTKSAKRRQSTW